MTTCPPFLQVTILDNTDFENDLNGAWTLPYIPESGIYFKDIVVQYGLHKRITLACDDASNKYRVTISIDVAGYTEAGFFAVPRTTACPATGVYPYEGFVNTVSGTPVYANATVTVG